MRVRVSAASPLSGSSKKKVPGYPRGLPSPSSPLALLLAAPPTAPGWVLLPVAALAPAAAAPAAPASAPAAVPAACCNSSCCCWRRCSSTSCWWCLSIASTAPISPCTGNFASRLTGGGTPRLLSLLPGPGAAVPASGWLSASGLLLMGVVTWQLILQYSSRR